MGEDQLPLVVLARDARGHCYGDRTIGGPRGGLQRRHRDLHGSRAAGGRTKRCQGRAVGEERGLSRYEIAGGSLVGSRGGERNSAACVGSPLEGPCRDGFVVQQAAREGVDRNLVDQIGDLSGKRQGLIDVHQRSGGQRLRAHRQIECERARAVRRDGSDRHRGRAGGVTDGNGHRFDDHCLDLRPVEN